MIDDRVYVVEWTSTGFVEGIYVSREIAEHFINYSTSKNFLSIRERILRKN